MSAPPEQHFRPRVRPGRRIVIANQIGQNLNGLGHRIAEALAARLPEIEFVEAPPWQFDKIPFEAEILLPWRFPGGRHVRDAATPPPPGWPFNLKWIQLLGAGTDAYPRWLFSGPPVTCMRGPSARPLAEYALAVILADLKGIPDKWVHRREDWTHQRLRAVRGTTVGIVGFGAVGKALAQGALALGMKVLAVRRTERPCGIGGVERAASLAELFGRSDFVVLAAPSTAATDHLISADILRHAKPGLHLINIGRGSLVDHPALLRALDGGGIRLATLDTTEPEPLPDGHPFYTHPAVRLTPHSSNGTPEFEAAVIDKFEKNIRDYIHGRALDDVVDVERGY
jgi:Phosphoglycerate dehydrogenase and related dehydrogenases